MNQNLSGNLKSQICLRTSKMHLNFSRPSGSFELLIKTCNIVLINNRRYRMEIQESATFFPLAWSSNWEYSACLPNYHDNKAVFEPRVSPAFAITYFCNHCNIRFENTSKYVYTLTPFSKNLNQRSLTPRWPLTPCLLRSHAWLYPRIIVCKSHDNTSMYVDTVINFANYHIHTHTTYIHILRTTYRMSDHVVSYWTHTTYYVQNEWSRSLLLNSYYILHTEWVIT